MSGKFSGIFKSFDNLKTTFEPVAKVSGAPAPRLPTPVHRHFESQNLAKRLRAEAGGGFFKAVRDARYDDLVVSSLIKSGITESKAVEFLKSDAGFQLGSTLHSTATKCLGISGRVRKSFDDWQSKWAEVIDKPSPVRKTASEFLGKAKDAGGHGSERRGGVAPIDSNDARTSFLARQGHTEDSYSTLPQKMKDDLDARFQASLNGVSKSDQEQIDSYHKEP